MSCTIKIQIRVQIDLPAYGAGDIVRGSDFALLYEFRSRNKAGKSEQKIRIVYEPDLKRVT